MACAVQVVRALAPGPEPAVRVAVGDAVIGDQDPADVQHPLGGVPEGGAGGEVEVVVGESAAGGVGGEVFGRGDAG